MPVRLGTGPVNLLLDKILKFISKNTLNRVRIRTKDLTNKPNHCDIFTGNVVFVGILPFSGNTPPLIVA
jgi:hypothetical protein